MLVDQFIGGRIPAERKIRQFEVDPAADLIVLFKPIKPSEGHPQPFELAGIIRVRDYQNIPFPERTINLPKIVSPFLSKRLKRLKATHYGFVNMQTAEAIMKGENKGPIAEILLAQKDFSNISVVDLKFNNGKMESTELTKEPLQIEQ